MVHKKQLSLEDKKKELQKKIEELKHQLKIKEAIKGQEYELFKELKKQEKNFR